MCQPGQRLMEVTLETLELGLDGCVRVCRKKIWGWWKERKAQRKMLGLGETLLWSHQCP